MLTVLLIEDEVLFAKSVAKRLQREGYATEISGSIIKAKASLGKLLPDVLLLDVRLPDGSGLDLLRDIRAKEGSQWRELPVIVMTAYGELDDAVNAMKLGATDYLKKPVDLDELTLTLAKVLQHKEVHQKLDYSQIRESQAADTVKMIGDSPNMAAIRQQLSQIAKLVTASVDTPPVVLLTGETGTGKDVAARFYHQLGSWNNKPFVHVDCSSLPKDLIEAELFGYERGAFTNAHQAKAGLIEVAEGGTLFLDEVGELPFELQAKLLNVLERRVVRRLGSTKEYSVKAHFVVATNRNLAQMVELGTFRSDLYFRLNILELELPALQDRRGDIELLVEHFVTKLARRYGLALPELHADAIEALKRYSWPGNIRELQHVLERAVMLCQQGIIFVEDLLLKKPAELQAIPTMNSAINIETMKLDDVEKYLIEHALNRTAGNVSRAARELGLTRMAMRYRMDKYLL
ncbi:MAG: sigma-54-dependent Fis family transcriptional regulator [Gammaproteobacteria bacterium]|nr:MAG: sigma-54-dependent Fis family transcriptional regulator [Gammaproteobacteria bacterium]